MNKIIPFYFDLNLESFYFETIKFKKSLNCYRSKMKIIDKFNNLNDILFQTDELILKDIIIDENQNYFLKLEIISNKLYDFLGNLENNIQKNVFNKSKVWFGLEPSAKLNDIYKSILVLPDNINDKTCLLIKLPINDGSIKSKFFNHKKELIGIKDINKRDKVRLIIKLNSIQLFENFYKIDMYLYQLQICDDITIDLNKILEESDEDIIWSDSDNDIININ